jgi:hypothetical protein
MNRRYFNGENAINMAKRLLYNDQSTQAGFYGQAGTQSKQGYRNL